MKNIFRIQLLIVVCACLMTRAEADGPALINYQGRVVVGNVNFNGAGQFKFALVNANGTTTYWSNNGTSTNGSEPSAAVSLTVTNGLYSVLLGDSSLGANMIVIPTTVFAQTDLRLRVWFNDGTHGSQLLSPDQRLAPNSYLASSAVSTVDLADGAVTSTKLATGAVGSTQIANGAVGTNQIATGGVSATQIANSTITSGKIASGQVVKTLNGLTDAITLAAGSNISITPSGSTLTLASTAASSVWSLNGTTAYYTGGNVGIGQTSATYKLELTDATSGFDLALFGPSPIIKFVDTSASNAQSSIRAFGGGIRIFNNAGATLAAFENSGSVGIGTSSPSYKVHVYDSANSITETIETGGGTNSWAQLRLKTINSNWVMGTSQAYLGDQLYFNRNSAATNQMALTSNGQLQITTPTGYSGFSHSDGTISVGSYIGGSSSGATGGWLGTFSNHPLYFFVNNGQPSMTINTDGSTSVKVLSITGGADLAEPFPIADKIDKGSVVVIDPEHPGHLKRSGKAYDRKVAGIVSGANGINPGIALHQDGAMDGDENVALSGRVYVKADDSNGPIEPGDLLTTSAIPGCAMKVTDYQRAQGAVIGKAMSSLERGRGTVLVLVSLQ